MALQELPMNEHTKLTETYLRFSRRSLIALFCLGLALGAFGLAVVLQPAGSLAHGLERAAWIIPIAIAIGVAVVQTTLRRSRWDPASAAAKAVLNDEFRQASLDRAARWTLTVVLLA